jgi:hypothetical protein
LYQDALVMGSVVFITNETKERSKMSSILVHFFE